MKLIIQNLPIGDFPYNFSHQIFFLLTMATKRVTAWSAESSAVGLEICNDAHFTYHPIGTI